MTVELPQGWQVSSVPPPQNQDASLIVYNLKVDGSGGTVHVVRKLDLDIMFLEPKYYPALRTFFQRVRTGDEEQILLQPAAAAARN